MLDFKGANDREYELIAKGTYEVVLTAEWKEVNGKKAINCKYLIRDDVEQNYQGRLVFDTIWESKTKKGEFTPSKIEKILDAIPNARYQFANYDEWIQYVTGMPMRVDIVINPADPQKPESKDRNEIRYDSWRQSLKPFVTGSGVSFGNVKPQTDVSLSDLPF